jgi:hypothetical protein
MKTIKEIYEEHLEKEPSQEFKIDFLALGYQMWTDEYRNWEYTRRRLEALINIPQEKREEILKVIKSGEKLGEVCKQFNLSLDIVGDILYYNIEKEVVRSLK